MAGIKLEWAQFGDFDSFDVLRATNPMDVNSLPSPIAISLTTMLYFDGSVIEGQTYYYRVRAWKDGVSQLSGELKAQAINDPYWANVVALLHFDNGVTDETGKEWSIVDTVSFDSTTKKFGASLNIVGSTGLVALNHVDFKLGHSDFTLECYIYPKSFTKNVVEPVIISISNNNSSGSQELFIGIKSASQKPFMRVYDNSLGGYVVSDVTSTAALSIDNWYHIAFCRSGTSHYLFIDGVKQAEYTTADYTLNNVDVDAIIGGIISAGSNRDWGRFDGYMDEVRITKGIARYTADFTLPDYPFPGA